MSHINKIPFTKALILIILSVFIFSLTPYFFWSYLSQNQKSKSKSSEFIITHIKQTGPIKEALKSEQLEELLGLSVNNPINLFAYDVQRGEKRLLDCPVIENVKIEKESPNALIVDYSLREPYAYISDYENLVIDSKGFLFPLSPFYTPKKLPKIYLGIQINPFAYGFFEDEKWEIAKEILAFFKKVPNKGLVLDQVDVSNLRANSLGKREIVVTLYDILGQKHYVRYLRLSKEHYMEEIEHFLSLKQMSLAEDLVIDLRLLPNAYLTPVAEEKKR